MIDEAVAALRAGKPAVLPFDTVYGLCANAYYEEAARRMYRLKGRVETQPTAVIAPDVDTLLECVPELRGRAGVVLRALLPGPYTFVVPNPARRFRWVTGTNPEAIGVRVPDLPEPTKQILDRVGLVVATSANHPGGHDPRRLEEVPEEFVEKAGAVVDVGPVRGTPSTVIDITGAEPRVLREAAVPADEALARVTSALSAG